jgi:hypothetical protein
MRHLFLLPLALAVVLISLITAEPPVRALAQDASPPVPTAGTLRTTLDLAAMALTADELPPGFRRGIGDTYTPGNLYGIVFAPHVSNEHLLAAGFLRNYETYYDAIDELASISVDIDEYATPEGAMAGFAVFTEETVPAPNFAVLSKTELPGPAVGVDPKAFTLTTYQYRDGTISHFVDASFRVENLIARIAYERFAAPSGSGMPAAGAGTPAALDARQMEQVEQVAAMAATLATRIEAVLAGETPPGTDLDLAAHVLPLAQLPSVWNGQGWEGYRDAAVVLGSDGPLLETFAADFESGYGRTVSVGTGSSPHPPYLSVAVARFATEEAARRLLDAVHDAPGALPPTGPFGPGAQHTAIEDLTVPGADAALAWTSALDEQDPAAPIDSATVVFVAGSRFVSITAQGLDSPAAARAAAEDLAAQQAACLRTEHPCTALSMPAGS